MDKFIEVYEFEVDYEFNKIKLRELALRGTILLNVENIKWIQMERFSSGYVIKVVTGEDYYAYAWEIAEENDAYEIMYELKEKLNK